jgi:hypothetical protein
MDILHSDWLVHMIEKSAKTPQARMLHLFDILDDWLDAPKIDAENEHQQHQSNPVLQNYLTLQARQAGANMPEMLANQLYYMLLAAINEKKLGNPASLVHAKMAAKALIAAQTTREFIISRKLVYASAVCLLIATTLTTSMLLLDHTQDQPKLTNVAIKPSSPQVMAVTATASPDQTAALFAKIEQMRKGNCQLIEAIQLPDAYKKVYFQNVVLGQISTDPEEQKLANQLLEMVRCNYTPMLMANSKD